MNKLLFWIFVICVGLLVARIAARLSVDGQRRQARQAPRDTAAGSRVTGASMVRCAHCGIQLPSTEAIRRRGYNYCSLAHSLKGRK